MLLCYLFDTDSTGLNRDVCVMCVGILCCWVEFDELYFSYLLRNA